MVTFLTPERARKDSKWETATVGLFGVSTQSDFVGKFTDNAKRKDPPWERARVGLFGGGSQNDFVRKFTDKAPYMGKSDSGSLFRGVGQNSKKSISRLCFP